MTRCPHQCHWQAAVEVLAIEPDDEHGLMHGQYSARTTWQHLVVECDLNELALSEEHHEFLSLDSMALLLMLIHLCVSLRISTSI
jgi:hypothetical protein